MPSFEETLARIIHLVPTRGTDAPPVAVTAADAYLAPFGLAQTAAERLQLLQAVEEGLPAPSPLSSAPSSFPGHH